MTLHRPFRVDDQTPARVPDMLPVLSRGRHRTARKGACFMELASYLAGERWSDHPKCTHPLLADLARHVNDHTADAHRSALGTLIPSVIGTSSDDQSVDARIALACARVALPVVSADRQNVMAVGVVTAERVLAAMGGGAAHDGLAPLSAASARVLRSVPVAERYAVEYTAGATVTPAIFRRHAAPAIVRLAVRGVAAACVPRPHELLRAMLVDSIAVCAAYGSGARTAPDGKSWAAVCELTASVAR